jgi:phosphoribosyl-dephospho-CoA transferase
MINIIVTGDKIDKIKDNITTNVTETISINGKEYKQVKEENTETGKKVYYIIKQEKSDVKNINIE